MKTTAHNFGLMPIKKESLELANLNVYGDINTSTSGTISIKF